MKFAMLLQYRDIDMHGGFCVSLQDLRSSHGVPQLCGHTGSDASFASQVSHLLWQLYTFKLLVSPSPFLMQALLQSLQTGSSLLSWQSASSLLSITKPLAVLCLLDSLYYGSCDRSYIPIGIPPRCCCRVPVPLCAVMNGN